MNIKIFISFAHCSPEKYEQKKPRFAFQASQGERGEDRARTDDLLTASQAL